jgi:Arc/MetJ-type ribon-helix-helix transcriptional regulator
MPKNRNKRKKMISINIPESFDLGIDLLMKADLVESRGDCIRKAVKELLNKDEGFIHTLSVLMKRKKRKVN